MASITSLDSLSTAHLESVLLQQLFKGGLDFSPGTLEGGLGPLQQLVAQGRGTLGLSGNRLEGSLRLLQQPFEQFAAPLDASSTEACSCGALNLPDSLQQLPEMASFPFSEASNCLELIAALGASQQPLKHASPMLLLFSEPALDTRQQESREARKILRENSIERRSLPRVERLDGAQQVSCPRASKARQIQPKASSVAAYLARAERRCWSHGLPSGFRQVEPKGSTGWC